MADIEPSVADFQLALDALRDGVIVWDAEGRALVANAAASRLFGLPDGLLKRALAPLASVLPTAPSVPASTVATPALVTFLIL